MAGFVGYFSPSCATTKEDRVSNKGNCNLRQNKNFIHIRGKSRSVIVMTWCKVGLHWKHPSSLKWRWDTACFWPHFILFFQLFRNVHFILELLYEVNKKQDLLGETFYTSITRINFHGGYRVWTLIFNGTCFVCVAFYSFDHGWMWRGGLHWFRNPFKHKCRKWER